MGDIIKGPWGTAEFDIKISRASEEEAEDMVDILTESYTEELFEWMRIDGFDNLGEMVYTKDLGLINEAIRSYMMKLQERYHPLQDVSEHFFRLEEDAMYIEPGVYVDFKDEEDD